MKTADYLDAAKKALQVESDYELALKLELPRQYVSRWRTGPTRPDAYACAKLAITLNLDPMQVQAEIQAEAEKNPKRAEFWRSFLSHARKGIAGVLVMLALVGSAMSGSDQKWHGGGARPRRRPLCVA